MTVLTDLKSLYAEELTELVLSFGQPKFRAGQLFDWLQKKGISSWDEMKNLPKGLLTELQKNYEISSAEMEKKLCSKLDETVKYLFRLKDGECIESVVMKYNHGYSICVSTQAGCRMGCRFCASTIDGKRRDLTAGEILSQIHAAQRDLSIRISNVVLMGMGEPLDNFDNVVRFLKLVSCERGLNIGMRHISLSTCGLVDQIRRLQTLNLQLTLSVSLHAPNNQIRDTMMPVNRKWPIETLIPACRNYIAATGRRISFEYALVRGVNDSEACADELAHLLRGMLCHVNLIPVNQVHEGQFAKPDKKAIYEFEQALIRRGIHTTVRRTLGADIAASCGQLRGKR